MAFDDKATLFSSDHSYSFEITTVHFNLSTNYSSDLSDTDVKAIREAAKWLWIIISPILLVFGLIGNIRILLVLWRIQVCKNLTYIFLFILATINTVVLIVGLTRYWILATFDFDIRDISTPGCVSQLFLIYFSMHMSSWTLVCITTIRFLKIKFSLRSFSRTLKILYIVTFAICLALDFHFVFTNGLILIDNKYVCNNTSIEYFEFEEKVFVLIDLAVLSVIPFIIMFVMNLFIGKRVLKSIAFRRKSISSNQSRQSVNRQSKRITRMLFFTSLYFLITTLPVSVLFVVDSYLPDKKSVKMEANLELAKAVLYLFQFSFYAVSFYIYIERRENFRKSLPCCKDKKESENPDSFSRGASSFSTASRYLSFDESTNGTNIDRNYTTEMNINTHSNTFVPNYQLPDIHQSSLSTTRQSITELPNRLS
ncbi:uncharacterized protein LOC127714968 [Mytilus californianus]|uniref:uncharacterized protein LOC127714968 n=1 Tax=Mytilus californianus TaxID=6549 RepID=UPI0022464DB7|nr:uncharacterized protein LOC127714968 [Mytilus californianus]